MAIKVVYIDDEPALCEIFKDNFESSDIEIKTFVHPTEALLDIAKVRPDLVFIDYRLPNTNGESVAKSIAIEIDSTIPKVLVTGDLSIQPSGLFVQIFSKPFNFNEVEAFIKGYIR